MALRRPHKGDEKLWAAGFSPIVWRSCPSPSGFQPRIVVRGVLLIAGMTRWAAGAYPGSESGTCFHSNRSCRLAPAHQGVKTRSCDLVWRVGTVDSATPHPDPCGGQAPALHFLIPPSTIGLQFGRIRRWRAGIEVDWRAHFRTNDDMRFAGYRNGLCRLTFSTNCLLA